MKKLGDLFHALRGFDEDTRYSLEHAKTYLSVADAQHLEYLLKYRQVTVEDKRFPVSNRLLPELFYPVFRTHSEEAEVQDFTRTVNAAVAAGVWAEQYRAFAKQARNYLSQYLAAHILGMDSIKEAVVLQLATPERIHILLLGDPGTGKTDILRSAADLAHKSSFGLGSGASKAGLSVSVTGKEVHQGILVQAHGGLCCIDELNLMKADDRAALYNAMEKGFVSYDKGSTHQQFAADIRLLATANPTGDQFRGHDLKSIKRQLPFDSALLSRFHLIFLVRKPDVKTFREISAHALQNHPKPLSTEDILFLHGFLAFVREQSVSVPAAVESAIVDAVTSYKAKEKSLLSDITPRLAKGILALTKARARLDLRDSVDMTDVRAVLSLVENSFPKGDNT